MFFSLLQQILQFCKSLSNYIYICICAIKFWSCQTVLHNLDKLSSKLTLIIVFLPLICHLSFSINLSIKLNLSSIKWMPTLTLREYKCLEAACLFETLWNSPIFLVLQISIGYLCLDSLKLLAFIIHDVRKATILMIQLLVHLFVYTFFHVHKLRKPVSILQWRCPHCSRSDMCE